MSLRFVIGRPPELAARLSLEPAQPDKNLEPLSLIVIMVGALDVRAFDLTGDDMASTNGTIKRLVHDKGFGFIAASDGSEYFFHQSSCQTPFDELREGQAVTFEKGQGPKGPRGENVKLA
jgi:CspA family cold shock protein